MSRIMKRMGGFGFAKVVERIPIRRDKIEIKFSRSSGPGGQNVNKVSTKVELRMDVGSECEWIPKDVKQRIKEYNSTFLTK